MIELKRCMKRFKRGDHCFQSSLDHRVGLRFGRLITFRVQTWLLGVPREFADAVFFQVLNQKNPKSSYLLLNSQKVSQGQPCIYEGQGRAFCSFVPVIDIFVRVVKYSMT